MNDNIEQQRNEPQLVGRARRWLGRRQIWTCAMAFAAALWALADRLPAQTRPAANIEGIVRDSSGSAIAGAYIHLRGVLDRDTLTDGDGRFSFAGLRPGDYRIVVEKTGFEPLEHRCRLERGPVRADLTLQLAVVRQAVDVIATADYTAESLIKLPGTLEETARAVTVVDSEELRRRNFRNVPELLAFVPGMSPNSYRSGAYHYYARGYRMLPDDTRVDGFAGAVIGGGSFGASTFGVEQVVVLRGPAGILYGPNTAPGGMINLISKRPQPVRSTQLDFRGGSFYGQGIGLGGRKSGSFDFDSTGAPTRSGRLLYRTLFTAENQNYFTRGVLDQNRYLRGSLLYKLDSLGLYSVTPVFQYGSMKRPAGGGIVVSPSTSLSANDGLSGPINAGDLSPHEVNLSAGSHRYQTSQAGFDFRGVPSPSWTVNLNYRWMRNDRHVNQWTPQVSTAAQIARLVNQKEVLRQQSKSDNRNRNHNVDFNAAYEYRGDSWRNVTQLGAYTRVAGVASTSLVGTAPAAAWPINIYTGLAQQAPADLYPPLRFGDYVYTTTWNAYWQNRTWLFDDRLVLNVALGYGQSHPGGSPVRKGDLVPSYSALYRATKAVALYYSYSESFNPVDPTLENILGQRNSFDPVIGRNHEAGAKWELPGRRATAQLSFFKNSISNSLVQSGVNDLNPNGVRYYVPAGTRRGKGVELSTEFQLRRDLFVQGAVSFINSVYTGEGPVSSAASLPIPGSRAEKTPRWSWNAITRYERTEGLLAGFGAGFALLWQDERLGGNGARTFSAPDPLLLPAYTRVDAFVSYRLNRHWDWSLNVENLTDRRIFINGTTGASLEMAPPRSATLRASFRF